MMEGLLTVFCGESDCSFESGKQCGSVLMFFTSPSSCMNNAFAMAFSVLLLFILLFNFIQKPSPEKFQTPSCIQGFLPLQMFSSIFNGGLGMIYFTYGIWILQQNLRKVHTILPLHQWLVLLFQGITWFLLSFIISLRGKQLPKSFLRLLSILACVFAGILCFSSLLTVSIVELISPKIVLDILLLPGAILLLLCTYKLYTYKDTGDASASAALYTPLSVQANGSCITDPDIKVTPYAEAGFIGKMLFWWLNPLVRKGKEKTLEEEDIPHLRELDRAKACYTLFMEQLNRHKESNLSTPPSILWTIVSCHWKDILISGFFALLKIITLSAGPLLLNAFIHVAEGKQAFKYEGYVLAISLFIAKCLESLSQRHWYFRARIIGLKVRSMLSAAIYRKQLRLSNAAKLTHSAGNIMNYVTVDAYRVGEFPFWFHQTWTTALQLCIALVILFHAVGLATFAALAVIVLNVLCNSPLAKLQNRFQTKLMAAQDERLKAFSEALVNMKVLKLYAWETRFKDVIERFRTEEYVWLKAVQMRKAYNVILSWSSPVLVSAATFWACYILGIPLNASNVFTYIATIRLLQNPVRSIPDVIGVVIQAKVSLGRIVKFLEAPELHNENIRKTYKAEESTYSICVKSANLSWEESSSRLSLRNISLAVKPGKKVAICGEVGSGKSTLLAAILGEVPLLGGSIEVYGKVAYVSQMAWIQTGTIQENIMFGSAMDKQRYHEVLEKCSLVKDLEMLPFGDMTEIGERGVNLSGGQKQRIQLARALYQDADIYLLDDPFSAVDAHTATSLFNEYVMGALLGKAVLLVTHQVDFLPAFDSILLMSDGEILHDGPYYQLLACSPEFQDLVNAHKDNAGSERLAEISSLQRGKITSTEIRTTYTEKQIKATRDQLIKQEERETGDTGFNPYIQYLKQNKGFLYFTIASVSHIIFAAGQISQNSWMAANVQNPHVSKFLLITVYLGIGCGSIFFLLFRSLFVVVLSIESSKSIFSQLLDSLFHAPMSFYDSTPLGRILSRVSSDLSIVDLDVPFSLISTVGSTTNACVGLGTLAVVTWQVLFVSLPVIYTALRLQKYYLASAKELMRINGTTKSFIANHLAESAAGAMTIRAFDDEDRFFAKNFDVIDRNASPFFHNFAANEWLIQRLELLGATVLSSSALAMVLLPPRTFGSGFVGLALSYGLSLNISLINSIQNQCTLANYIISVERLNQYTHIPSEAPEIIEENQPPPSWPAVGKVEIHDLKIRYRPDTPLVLSGISCTFEGGHKIGIVGRTGSGKTTLINALFRLVEPEDGNIIIDNLDISTIGLHDLRSRIGIIPQDPTLFNGTIRYNLDPLSQYTDKEIWEILKKCQLQEAVQEKDKGLDALVIEDGSNWSMGQRQLFCLGRVLLRRSRILVLDEATASIDTATDSILQKTIRTEFADCTVITVAHRIPTIMDCTKVVAMADGKVVEYDEPTTLMTREGSLFGKLVKEYWSHFQSANHH